MNAAVPGTATESASERRAAAQRWTSGRTATKLVTLVCASILSSCTTFQSMPIDPAALSRSFEARTLQSAELQRYLASQLGSEANGGLPRTWDLATLTLAAFYFSPELDVARAKSATTDAAVQTASQRPNPSLQIPFQYTANPKPGDSAYTLGLGLDIPIETAGKRGYRITQARQLSIAARLQVGSAAWQVRSKLRSQLLNLYLARQRTEMLDRQTQVQQDIVQMLVKRLDVGAASMPEVRQARATLIRERLDLANAGQQALEARAGAAAVIGIPLNALAQVDIRLDAFDAIAPEVPGDMARSLAILNRADVQAALADYEASQAALQLEIARQYPDIHLGPGYTYDAGARKFALPVSGIELPLFNRNEGPIAQAVARRAEMAARLNAVQAQAIGDAARAAQNYRSALAGLRMAQALRSTQEKQLEALRRVYQAGQADRLSLATAEHDFLAGSSAYWDAIAQVERGVGLLEDAMQRPLSTTALAASGNPGTM